MSSGEPFGESEEIPKEDACAATQQDDRVRQSADFGLNGWTGHLLAVDEELTIRLWKRLLADADALKSLLTDDFIRSLHDAMQTPLRVSADINASYIAKSLSEISDTSFALPLGLSTSVRNGYPLRVTGSIATFRKVTNGWTMTIGTSPNSALIRFRDNVFMHARPRDLIGQDVLILGIVENLHRLELTGIALITRRSS